MSHALIVDDNRTFRGDLSDLIARRFPGVEVHQAGDTAAARHVLESQTFDVVFVDIELPGESGLALTRRLQHRYPSLVKVVMTVHDLPEFREAALALGADYFVPKESRDEMEATLNTIQYFLGPDTEPLTPTP